MSKAYHIKNATLVNEHRVFPADVFLSDGIIERISKQVDLPTPAGYTCIDAKGLHLLPGVIDDQVHFREPGLEYKADIYTESKAAVAGGTTSFMEMPNCWKKNMLWLRKNHWPTILFTWGPQTITSKRF